MSGILGQILRFEEKFRLRSGLLQHVDLDDDL